MMKYCLLLMLSLTVVAVNAQSTLSKTATGLKVLNKQFVIENNSTAVNGALINKDKGKTAFSEVGKDFQFVIGNAGAPAQGDSIYTNAYLIKRYVKVWRNGLLQFNAASNGVRLDSLTGKVVFSPAFIAGDKIYIEALNGF